MRKYLTIICIILIIIAEFSCSQQEHSKVQSKDFSIFKEEPSRQSYLNGTIKYAKWFDIQYYNDYKLLIVYNPWRNNQIYYKYLLVAGKKQISEKVVGITAVIHVPVEKAVSLSSSHIGMISELDLINKLCAIGSSKYIYNQEILSRVNNQEIFETGDIQQINIEKLISLSPEIVLLTGWSEISLNENKLMELGIPFIYILEWMENTPLGRAEWIKFIAVFFNKEAEAEKIFSETELQYFGLKDKIKDVIQKPKVLHGICMDGTWFVPGGQSYIANLYNDAGAEYLWKNDTTTGSIPLSPEAVIQRALNADIWLNTNITDENAYLLEK
ncbi:MAG: ABC transporter substrate-binding protein, partial [Bacteroidia bacterium]|nr:ABC transporter substrate-binding protein [Bacteroidia bacterium]